MDVVSAEPIIEFPFKESDMSLWLKIRKNKKIMAMMIANVKYMIVYSGLQENIMKFVRIDTLEEMLEEVYQHFASVNA